MLTASNDEESLAVNVQTTIISILWEEQLAELRDLPHVLRALGKQPPLAVSSTSAAPSTPQPEQTTLTRGARSNRADGVVSRNASTSDGPREGGTVKVGVQRDVTVMDSAVPFVLSTLRKVRAVAFNFLLWVSVKEYTRTARQLFITV